MVVRRDTLHKTPSEEIKILYCPVINTHGTHVAFMALAPDNSSFIGVAAIDDKSFKYKKIAPVGSLPKPGSMPFQTNARLDWPKGDYLWYCPRGWENGQKDNVEDLYRINVQTGEVEHVLRFATDLDFRCLTWDSRYLMGMSGWVNVYEVPDLSDRSKFPLAGPDYKWTWSSGGCGHVISPTGTYSSKQTNSGHSVRNLDRINIPENPQTDTLKGDSAWSVSHTEWNDWAVDKSNSWVCTAIKDLDGDGVKTDTVKTTRYVGGGIHELCNRFTRNSDYLLALLIGSCDRFSNMTFALIDWKNKRSWDLNQFPRQAGDDSSTTWWVDFWVKEPAEMIVPELRGDVTAPYHIADISASSGNPPDRRFSPSSGNRTLPAMLRNGGRIDLFDIAGRRITAAGPEETAIGRMTRSGVILIRSLDGNVSRCARTVAVDR
jgi:hypothetical protein